MPVDLDMVERLLDDYDDASEEHALLEQAIDEIGVLRRKVAQYEAGQMVIVQMYHPRRKRRELPDNVVELPSEPLFHEGPS